MNVLRTYVHVKSLQLDSAPPWTVARQAPLSMGFSRQEDWSGLPCPPPGDLLNTFGYFQLPAPWRNTHCQAGHLLPSGHASSPGPWSSCAHKAW